jgi:CHAT domain-containing protein/tetratricopeptide (TPR) repeat protein
VVFRRIESNTFARLIPIVVAGLALALAGWMGANQVSSTPDGLSKSQDLDSLQRQLSELSQKADYDKAAPVVRQYIDVAKARFGEDSVEYAKGIGWEAFFHSVQARPARAVPLYERALEIFEKRMPLGDPLISSTLNNLAFQHMNLGQFDRAEPLFQRALEVREKALERNLVSIAGSVNNLATLYRAQGRNAEAEPLLKRALQLRRQIWPEGHAEIAASLGNLALLYHAQRRYGEAEPLLVEALEMRKRLQPAGHPEIAGAMNNLAMNYSAQDRIEQAQPLFEQTLEMRQKNQPPDHPEVASSINNLAMNYFVQEKYDAARQLFERALAIQQRSLPPDHPQKAATLQNLAALEHERGRPAEALAAIREASGALVARGVQDDNHFRKHVTIAWSAVDKGVSTAAALFAETFLAGQRATHTRAAQAVSRMAARLASDDPALTRLIRSREELVEERSATEKALSAALALPLEQRRGADDGARRTLAEIARRMGVIDQRLRADFPDYFALVSPEPLTVAGVQAQLGADEALIMFLDTREWYPSPEGTFIWAITKTAALWVRSGLGTKALGDHVAALRCGLDVTLWDDAASWPQDTEEQARERTAQMTRRARCGALTMSEPKAELVGTVAAALVLPFDAVRAHALYMALLGQLGDPIRNKHLIVVPSGPLTVLPLSVLVVEPPATRIPATLADYRRLAWLGTRQPITVLPSVGALQALRVTAGESRAQHRFLGIGNPLLDGPGDRYALLAQDARDRQSCPRDADRASKQVAQVRSRAPAAFQSMFRGGHADIERVRQLAPLPETADELCHIRAQLGVPESDVLLGANATERAIKGLSASGRLAGYQILHFATHGALAGQVKGIAEPGLVLTPPRSDTRDPKSLEEDDGFLTASEIATLRLDANWVILSACNTAAGAGGNAEEGLSGLARAFFYAGARALLVSHWEVGSASAVVLTTRALEELEARPNVGRAEALRISMGEIIKQGQLWQAHPSEWAPFVVAGVGAR